MAFDVGVKGLRSGHDQTPYPVVVHQGRGPSRSRRRGGRMKFYNRSGARISRRRVAAAASQPWLRLAAERVNAATHAGFRIVFKPTRDGN